MPVQSVSVRQRSRKLSNEVRDQIVLDHLPLVKAIAIRVHENLPVHVDLDDLVHAGVMGLFDAVTKYDAAKNVAFQAYAKHHSRPQRFRCRITESASAKATKIGLSSLRFR